MNIWSLIDSGELKPVSEAFCKEKVWIVDVPELAKALEFNSLITDLFARI